MGYNLTLVGEPGKAKAKAIQPPQECLTAFVVYVLCGVFLNLF